MGKNYYYLVSSLPEYTFDSDTKNLNFAAVLAEIYENISKTDSGYVTFLLNYFDVQNIINALAGRSDFNELGRYTREEVAYIRSKYSSVEEEEKKDEPEEPIEIPGYLETVLAAYHDPAVAAETGTDTRIPIDNALLHAYLRKAVSSRNDFIRKWFVFERDLRNISAAHTARVKNMDIYSAVIGIGNVAEALCNSTAADFGLKGTFESIDPLLQILETKDMLSKEKRLDTLRWDKINDIVTFDYFNIDAILATVAKLGIIHRWMILDKETGEKMFRKLVGELTDRSLLKEPEDE